MPSQQIRNMSSIMADGITPTLSGRNKARAAMDRLIEAIVIGNH